MGVRVSLRHVTMRAGPPPPRTRASHVAVRPKSRPSLRSEQPACLQTNTVTSPDPTERIYKTGRDVHILPMLPVNRQDSNESTW